MPIDSAEVDLRATFPQTRKYGLDREASVAMEQLTYTLDIRSPAPRDTIARLVETAAANCHAESSLRVSVPIVSVLRVNGDEVQFAPPGPAQLRR